MYIIELPVLLVSNIFIILVGILVLTKLFVKYSRLQNTQAKIQNSNPELERRLEHIEEQLVNTPKITKPRFPEGSFPNDIYKHARKMLKLGGSIDEVINCFNLPRGEVELLFRLNK